VEVEVMSNESVEGVSLLPGKVAGVWGEVTRLWDIFCCRGQVTCGVWLFEPGIRLSLCGRLNSGDLSWEDEGWDKVLAMEVWFFVIGEVLGRFEKMFTCRETK
jgi:hypothetical protein